MTTEKLPEAALGWGPWCVRNMKFGAAHRMLTIAVDVTTRDRFLHLNERGTHLVHGALSERYRHLNFFEHEGFHKVRAVPWLRLLRAMRLVEPL